MGQKLITEITEDPGPQSGQWRDQKEPEVSHIAHQHHSSEVATGSRGDAGASLTAGAFACTQYFPPQLGVVTPAERPAQS